MLKIISRWIVVIVMMMAFLVACGGNEAATPNEVAVTDGTELTEEIISNENVSPAPSSDEMIEISLWIAEGDEEFLIRLEEEFEAQNPTIDLKFTEIPEGEYFTKIDTALAAGQPPEIAFIYEPRWVKAGKVLSIKSVLEEQGIDLSNYNQGSLGANCLVDGDIYCMGTYSGGVVLFFNKDMFDAAGLPYPSSTEAMSVEEYANIAAQLANHAENIEDRVWGGSSDLMVYWEDPINLFSSDGRTVEINDEATIAAHQILAGMINAGDAPSSSDFELIGATDLAAAGKQATWLVDNVLGVPAMDAVGNINWGVAPLPVEKAGDQAWVSSWTDAYGVFADSENPEAAMKFIAFVATEGNRLRAEAGGLPLDLALAREMDWAGDSPGRQDLLKVMELARAGIFIPSFWEVIDPMWDSWFAIVDDGVSAQVAFDEAAILVQENLDQAWETFESIK